MRYTNVVIIGIDGMGNYNRFADTPNIDALFQNGSVTYDGLSMDPTISAENWGSMLIGCNPGVHGLTNSIVGRYEYKNEKYPSVFSRIRKKYPHAYLASCSTWDPINTGIIERDSGTELITADNDEILCGEIEKVIEKKPVLLFIQFDNVDGAGHRSWYGTPEYLKQVEITDSYVGRIADAYKKAGIYESTLFICLADHGGIRAGHGGYTKEERTVFFAVSGKGIVKNQMGFAQTKDVAAIVLYALDIEYPQYEKNGFSSQIPDNIFADRKNDYIVPSPKSNIIKTKETKPFKGEKGLASYFPEDKIKLAMFFDNEIKDETGKNKFTQYGNIKYYSSGVCGSRAEFGTTGYGVTEDLKFGNKSFTSACWLMTDKSLTEEVCVFSTQDWFWRRRKSTGFTLVFRDGDTRFSVSNGDDRLELTTPYHEDISDGWIHVISVFDKENSRLRIYHNFKLVRICPVEKELICDMDNLPFTVGNDGAHQHNDKEFNFIFSMDDLFIFDGAFTDDDVQLLKKYYE